MPFVDLEPTPLGAVTDRPKDFVVTPGAADVELGSDAPDFKSTLGAAFRQDNIIGSFMARKDANLPMDKEDGFDAWTKIKGTPLEEHWDSFTDVHNQRAFDMRTAQIKQEQDDKQTLASAPWYKSVPAQLTAGILDPVNLLPAGYVLRTAKGGISIAKTAAASGLLTGASSAAQEAVLHNTQQTRTAEDTVAAIGTSVILGSLLGGVGAKVLERIEHREFLQMQEALDRSLAGEPPPPGSSAAPVYENDFLREYFASQNAALDKAEADLGGLKADIAAREAQAGVTGEVSTMPGEAGAQAASETGFAPTIVPTPPRINGVPFVQGAAKTEAKARLTASDMLSDIPGALDNGSINAMRFASAPKTEEIDALIEAGKKQEDAAIDRIFGDDAEKVKGLLRRGRTDEVDDIVFEKFGENSPEAKEANGIIYGMDDHAIVNTDSLKALRDRLSNLEFAVVDAAKGDTTELSKELAWVSPHLPDINAPEASHTETQRIAVLSLARAVEDMQANNIDPTPILKDTVNYTVHRLGGGEDKVEDAALLLDRLSQYAKQFMNIGEGGKTSEPSRPALPAPAVASAVDASKQIRAAEETGNLASIPEASAAAKAEPTVEGGPVGVFMFDPTALKVDAKRFQFKEGGNEQGVTTALKGVTKWDRAKGNQVIVWQDKGGDLYIVDGHQRSGLARRLIESGKEKKIELPGLLYREADGVSAEDVRAIAAVKNIAEGSGSSLDGAKVLRSRPDLMDGSLPLSAGKGRQAAALSRLDDEAFRMVVNDVVPENYGAIVGERIPDDGPRQIAAIKAIAKFKPENETQAAVLVQRVSDAELAKAEEGAQGSMFGDLESADSTAGEEMKIVGRAIKELQKDKTLFQRVVANANRIEETGSNIERQSAKEVTTEAEMFARRLASDAYSPGPLRDELKAAAKDLQSEKIQIGEAVSRIRAALGRAAEDDGATRAGNRARSEQAASTGATSGQSISEPAPVEALFDDIRPAGARERDAASSAAPAVEPGAEGKPQILIEGVNPVTDQDRAAAGIARPLRGGNAPAGGMFDQANTDQFDMLSGKPEAPDLGGQTNYNAKPGSVSAASVTPANLEDNAVAGKAAAFVAYNSLFPTKAGFTQFNPLLRALASPSAVVRDIMLKLVENPIYLKKNMEGIASDASAETLMKQWDAGLARAVETTTKAFSDYRKSGGRMTYIEFREAVGKAMRRGDVSAEPAVEKVAKDWRKNVFDPLKEAAINAGLLPEDVSVDTAVSYFSRMWNRQKLIAQEPQFKQIVRDWVNASFPRWQAGFDRETMLKSAKLSGDKLRAYQAERLRERERLFGIEPGEVADTVADEVFDTLAGRTDGGARPELITIKARGPLAERTFNIPDELVEDFLVDDVLGVGARYSRVMRADVEIANKFGAPDMKEQINAINANYKELSALAETETQRIALDVARRNDIADVEAMRDIMRGVGYKLPHVWEKNFDHISRLARHFNYIRSMGEASLASLAESVRPAMVHGLMPYMETIGNLAFNLKGVKLSIEEAKRAGNISERVLGHRIAGLMEISDPYATKGATEAMLENLTSVASVWNGIRLLTDWQKSVAAVMTQDRILKGAKSYTSIPQSEKAYLAYLGINERMAERIFQQFDTHGLIVDGVRVAKTENWTDEAAKRAYYAAINKDIDSIITTRGVADVPLFSNTPVGAAMLQFRTFALAAHQRVLLRGLQEDQTRFLGGIIAMTTIGMMTTWLKAVSANREEKLADFSKKPGWWISEGLDRAGILAGTMEVANAIEKVTSVNPIKAPIQAFDEGGRRESQRIQNRNAWGAIAGPTIGLGDDIVTALGIPSAVAKGQRVSKAQKNAAERLVPFSSYPFVRQMMRYVINPQ